MPDIANVGAVAVSSRIAGARPGTVLLRALASFAVSLAIVLPGLSSGFAASPVPTGNPESAALADAGAGSATHCEEDRSSGDLPTISSRFDPKENGTGGSAFAAARARAARYCANQACTVDGHSMTRTAAVYGLGSVARGKLIVGFVCTPAITAPAPPQSRDVRYRLAQPSDIDAALAQARRQCAGDSQSAELSDLQERDGALVAIFSCGS